MKAKKNAQAAGRLETILEAAPRCGLILDLYPDSFGYKTMDGRARRMEKSVTYSANRHAARIQYGSGDRHGRICLESGHDCYIVAAVLGGEIEAADALKSIHKEMVSVASGKNDLKCAEQAACIIRNSAGSGLADEIRAILGCIEINIEFMQRENIYKSISARLVKIAAWMKDVLTVLLDDVRPETIPETSAQDPEAAAESSVQEPETVTDETILNKEEEETKMKTYAIYYTDAPEQAMLCEAENKKEAEKKARLYRRQWNISGKIDRIERRDDVQPIQKIEEKEEETEMKTAAETIPAAQEPETERPEIIPMTEAEMEEFHEDWRETQLARVPEKWREKVAAILDIFPAVYGRLYEADAESYTPGQYSAELDLFSAWMDVPEIREFITHCANVRGDLFTSDREIVAYVIACREAKAAKKRPETISETAAESSAQDPETARPETISARNPEKPARGPAKEKSFAGESISGKGWSIVFDTGLNRTRVIVSDPLRETLRPMIENAGFFFSKAQNSWNKKLTHRAYRAAVSLADEIRSALAS